jgi:hypothetical protein
MFPPDEWATWEVEHSRWLGRIALALVAFGLAWRTTRYLLAMPIWSDEAMLLVNYITRGYADIFGPIDHCQVAPLLFHWAEIAVIRTLGMSELSVRLPAYMASCLALILFWRLTRATTTPLAGAIAVGMLSVAIWPASMAGLCKPYAWDLLVGAAFLGLRMAGLGTGRPRTVGDVGELSGGIRRGRRQPRSGENDLGRSPHSLRRSILLVQRLGVGVICRALSSR